MQSFRTEIENPIVEKDILELEKKIHQFKEGKLDEEEQKAVPIKTYPINAEAYPKVSIAETTTPKVEIEDNDAFEIWKSTNLVPQKQEGFVAIGIKVLFSIGLMPRGLPRGLFTFSHLNITKLKNLICNII